MKESFKGRFFNSRFSFLLFLVKINHLEVHLTISSRAVRFSYKLFQNGHSDWVFFVLTKQKKMMNVMLEILDGVLVDEFIVRNFGKFLLLCILMYRYSKSFYFYTRLKFGSWVNDSIIVNNITLILLTLLTLVTFTINFNLS